METKVTSHIVKGLIIALILIVFGIAIYLGGLIGNKSVAMVQYLILFVGICYGCISYSNQLNHNVTFGNVFTHGFKITAVTTVIMVAYTVIAIKFIFPEMVNLSLDQARESLEKNNMSDEQIEKATSLTKKFFLPFAIAGILVGFMIFGLISSLIGAAIAKKKPQGPFVQQG